MNRGPILFRVDGTSQLGWERLNRCLTYAAALQRRRRPTYFLAQLGPRSLALNVKRVGNQWIEAAAAAGGPGDLEQTLREARRLQASAVVVDSATVTEDYLAELRAAGPLVVSIDHLAGLRFPSQLVINPLLAPGKEAYEFHRGTQLLLGARYALVRPEVRRVRPLRSTEPPAPFRALVVADEDNAEASTGDLVNQLLNTSRIDRVDVVVRSHHPHFESLKELAEAHADRLQIATEPAEVAARLVRCHFALSAGGNWSLELACVGVPQLILVGAEAQWPTVQRLEEEGAAVCLGSAASTSAQTIRQAVNNLLGDAHERKSMSRCGRKLIDGRGPDRVVTAIEVLLHRPQPIALGAAA